MCGDPHNREKSGKLKNKPNPLTNQKSLIFKTIYRIDQ